MTFYLIAHFVFYPVRECTFHLCNTLAEHHSADHISEFDLTGRRYAVVKAHAIAAKVGRTS
ncbi:hypothetical protein D3C80_2046570 [compost metagenome]